MPRKWTQDELQKIIYDLVGDEYTVLDIYTDRRTYIKFRHNCEECGNYEFEMTTDKFINCGQRCRICARKAAAIRAGITKQKPIEEYRARLKELTGDEYSLLCRSDTDKDYALWRHNPCGHEWWSTFQNIYTGGRCPICYHGESQRKSGATKQQYYKDHFVEWVHDAVGDEYTVLGEYGGCEVPVKMRHNKCGRTFEMTPKCFLSSKHRCPLCAKERQGSWRRLTNAQFLQYVQDTVSNEYTVLTEYTNYQTPVTFRHNCDECRNHEFTMTPAHFLSAQRRCPASEHRRCTSTYYYIKVSSGEKAVANFLSHNHIEFIPQYKFHDCRNIHVLPFDFYLPNYNMCIEFDGAQHFEPVDFWGGDEGFAIRQENDNIKTNYCLEHGIKLLRIPYWDESNIPNILTEELL